MFKKTLKSLVIGMGLTAALLASAGCDEDAAKVALRESRLITDGPAAGLGGQQGEEFVSITRPFADG